MNFKHKKEEEPALSKIGARQVPLHTGGINVRRKTKTFNHNYYNKKDQVCK